MKYIIILILIIIGLDTKAQIKSATLYVKCQIIIADSTQWELLDGIYPDEKKKIQLLIRIEESSKSICDNNIVGWYRPNNKKVEYNKLLSMMVVRTPLSQNKPSFLAPPTSDCQIGYLKSSPIFHYEFYLSPP